MKKLYIYSQYLLPRSLLTKLMGILAESRSTLIKDLMIKIYLMLYKIDMHEALQEDPTKYQSFNDFFSRPLKKQVRPIDKSDHTIVSPVDGIVTQFGTIEHGSLIQAKGKLFQLLALVGGQKSLANQFDEGSYATLYLAPHHYHRFHLPIAARLVQTIFIPGDLFSVNQTTSAYVANLYSRNERLICVFETKIGPMLMILVGAMIVGSIQLSWMEKAIKKQSIEITQEDKSFDKGEELGCFKLGSTVILIFGKDKIVWNFPKQEVRMGQVIGIQIS